jgi:formamidopyrimidine-DNA glycosylase
LPELPEVETIRRALQSGGRGGPAIPGWQIMSADLLWDKTLAVPDKSDFKKQISGQKVKQINRRAKYLDIELGNAHLLIHLRMSGDIRVEEKTGALQPHDRLVIAFTNAYRLVFNDTRKFGRVWFVEDPDIVLKKIGPEPLDESLTEQEFFEQLRRRKRQLKPLLLDQSFIAGLGNIYTDEALHLAGLHPLLIASELSREQASELLSAIRRQLNEGISRNGASIDWVYRGGSYQNSFRVYGRSGKPCADCGTLVTKIKVGQRGTHICPQCQPFSNPEHK